MRILIATPLYPPEIGGPATYSKMLEEELPKRGVEVELVKFTDVRYLPNVFRQIAFCLRTLSQGKNADIILALDAVSVGWPVYVANLFLHKKLVVKIVGDHVWEQGSQRFGITDSLDAFPTFSRRWHPYLQFLRVLQFRVVRNASWILVPSEYLKYTVSRWGVPSKKISVIYNAVPTEVPDPLPEAVAALPRPLIVSIGRLVPWKGFEGLIDAVNVVRSRGLRASLAIVGDGPLKEEITMHVREQLGIHGVFIGKLSHKETLAVIKNADAFVLNSSYEGLSHTLIEALTLGAPIIATRAGGNTEVITDTENGLLVPVGDTPYLAHCLTALLTDKKLRERLRKNAKTSASRFSLDSMISDTLTLLKSLP